MYFSLVDTFLGLPVWQFSLVLVVFGAFVGAFWNRLVERMPFDKSLRTQEVCPHCGKPVSIFKLFPILGYVFSRGKYGCCGGKIKTSRIVIEYVTAILALVTFLLAEFLMLGSCSTKNCLGCLHFLLALEWLVLTLVPVCIVDFKYHLLPDTVTIGGIVVGVLLSFMEGGISPLWSVLGAVIAGGGLYVFSKIVSKLLGKEAMGFGDVKLLAGFGAIMGAPLAIETLILGSFLGILVIVPARTFKKKSFSTEEETSAGEFPFGPFLAIAAPIIFLFGNEILDWYLAMFEV